MRRLGRRWYERALAMLPAWLREDAGPDMRAAFDEAQTRSYAAGGAPALLALWLREFAGLIGTAWRSRRPDGWTRRTAPRAGDRSHLYTGPTMDTLRSDLHFALRTFARRPGLALLAVVTLALGIGSSTAMYSVVDSVLLRPLPYPAPERIMRVYPTWPRLVGHPTMGGLALRGTWSWPELWLVDEQQSVFEHFAGYSGGEVTLAGDGTRPEQIAAGIATQDLFPLLGVDPLLGRLFDENDGSGGEPSVLLSYAMWRDRFGSDPGVLGRSVRIDDTPRTVIGVLPEDFAVTGLRADVWIARRGSSTDNGLGNHGGTRALARLAEGVTPERAQEEVARILRTLPEEHGAHGANVQGFQAELTRGVRPVLFIMLAASGVLLLVACGNVAALLLGAGIDRERELAVRGAVGASRGRLIQQLLTESLMLALAAAFGGIALAGLTTRALALLAPPGVPRIASVAVDGGVLAFAVFLAVTCGVVFGLVPALSLSTTEFVGSIGSTRTTGSRRARLQSAVVIGELALATVLLVGAALLGRTVLALGRVDPGFRAERLVAVSVALPRGRFNRGNDSTAAVEAELFERSIVDALASAPGVAGVKRSSSPPFFGWRGNNDVLPEGWAEPDNAPTAERRFVDAGYFAFMGIPLVEGRDFQASDLDDGAEQVVVISAGLADLAWPGQSAVGRTMQYWGRDARVIGVAEDINDEQLEGTTSLSFYAPASSGSGPGSPLLVRTAADPSMVIPAIRERIWSVDPDLPITRIATMQELMGDQVSDQVYRARLMMVFAGLAGVFSLLGVYGVTARSVARRTREMGLRVALGADRTTVLAMVTREAVRLAAGGVALGLVVALVVGGVLERFLWGVSRTDPATLVAVGIGVPLLAALAALPPARRATRVDPLEALRAE